MVNRKRTQKHTDQNLGCVHPLMVHWTLRVSNSEMTFSQGQVSDPALSAGENKGLCGDVRQYVAQGNPQFYPPLAG